jgi:hypothetical protein
MLSDMRGMILLLLRIVLFIGYASSWFVSVASAYLQLDTAAANTK